MVDRFTRWPEAVPLKETDALTCTLDCPFWHVIGHDFRHGPTVCVKIMYSIILGTTLHHTTAYHPQANGLVERFHRPMKSALRARLTSPNRLDELPWVLMVIQTAPKEDLNCSSAELVYGAQLTVSLSLPLQNIIHMVSRCEALVPRCC